MKHARTLAVVLNACHLVLGGLVGIAAVIQTIQLIGEEPSGFSLRRGIPGLVFGSTGLHLTSPRQQSRGLAGEVQCSADQ